MRAFLDLVSRNKSISTHFGSGAANPCQGNLPSSLSRDYFQSRRTSTYLLLLVIRFTIRGFISSAGINKHLIDNYDKVNRTDSEANGGSATTQQTKFIFHTSTIFANCNHARRCVTTLDYY
jgi:hypothetical protein